MPDGVRMRISSLLAVVMVLSLLECRWYTTGTMDTLVADDLETGDGQKLSVVAYGALLDMILRGTIAAGEPVTERLIAARLGMFPPPPRRGGRRGGKPRPPPRPPGGAPGAAAHSTWAIPS